MVTPNTLLAPTDTTVTWIIKKLGASIQEERKARTLYPTAEQRLGRPHTGDACQGSLASDEARREARFRSDPGHFLLTLLPGDFVVFQDWEPAPLRRPLEYRFPVDTSLGQLVVPINTVSRGQRPCDYNADPLAYLTLEGHARLSIGVTEDSLDSLAQRLVTSQEPQLDPDGAVDQVVQWVDAQNKPSPIASAFW